MEPTATKSHFETVSTAGRHRRFALLTTLDRFVLRRFLSTFFFVCLIFALIACVIDYSEKIEDFSITHPTFLRVMGYFLDFAPQIVAFLYPLFIFISTIFFTSKMAYKTEIIAILAAGVSFHRFMRPYFIGALLMSGLFALGNHVIIPKANKHRFIFEARYVKNFVPASDKNVHLQLSPTLIVYLERYFYATHSGERFTEEIIDGTQLKEKLFADQVTYDSVKKEWKLLHVTVRKNDSLRETLTVYPELVRKYNFTPSDLRKDNEIQSAMPTKSLLAYIDRQRLYGNENLNQYWIEIHRRTAQPFAGVILVIIAAAIASRKVRGGSGLHLVIGIVLSAVYVLMLQLSQTFSIKAGLHPLLAVWIPNMLFAVVAIVLYRREVT